MNRSGVAHFAAAALGLMFALTAFLILTNFTQSAVGYLTFKGTFPPNSLLHVEAVNIFGARKLEIVEIGDDAAQTPVLVGTQRWNFPVADLVLEFHVSPEADISTPINFHHIQLVRPYLGNLLMGQQQIKEFFNSSQFVAESQAMLAIDPQSRIARLQLKQPFSTPFNPAYVALALLIGLAVYLLVWHAQWSEIPAFRDMNLGNKISSPHEFNNINGLRGLAAILVLLSHTAPGFFAIQLGLSLLFIFSGFLLSKPFVADPMKIYSWPNIQKYLTKRLKRILPAYYLYVFMIYVVPFELDTALRHFLFVQAEGHLWPMTQIFTFYMLLPLVLIVTCVSYRVHRLLPLLITAAGAYLWWAYATDWKPFYNGVFSHEFMLYAFLTGVFGSYLHYDLLQRNDSLMGFFERYKQPIAVVAGIVALLTIAWSAPVRPPAAVIPYISQFYVKCILSLLIILFALNIKDTWYNVIVCNWFFRSMGVIGFSFYILHGLGMQIVLHVQTQLLGISNPSERSWEFFFASLAVTYVMAVFSYSYVERPFFGYREKNLASQV
ncbi:MAG: acyltransferase [Gammaproteobacteria bacterium]|nr:acyltransferase [Gammaproteobacteria bacterium]